MRDGLKDLSTLTTIPYHTLTKLSEKLGWVICDCLEEGTLNNSDYVEIDVGIGELHIMFTESEVKYRFVPSKKFEQAVVQTVVEKKNPLTKTVEEALVSRIINTYKDFF